MNKSHILYYFIFFIILLLIFEFFSYILIYQTSFLDRYFFHKHHFISEADFRDYKAERNKLTGWPTRRFEKQLSFEGSRKSPANNMIIKKEACFSIYGDSYAFDSEVNNDQAWPNKLAEIMNCKIHNFGIPGFGIDQAYLRFKEKNPKKLDTILTFIEGDYRRARTRMYSLQNGEGIVIGLTKPMFELSQKNKIILKKNPINSYEEYLNLSDKLHFKKIFSNDLFIPDQDLWSMSYTSFPNSLEIVLLSIKIFKRQISYSAYLPFYPSYSFLKSINLNQFMTNFATPPPSYRDETIKLNEAIFESFIADCNKLNIKCYIAPLPLIMDFDNSGESKIIKSLKSNEYLRDKLLLINKGCMTQEFKKVGIKKSNISEQLAPGRHYNYITSNIIAKCLAKKIQNKS